MLGENSEIKVKMTREEKNLNKKQLLIGGLDRINNTRKY